MVTCEYELQTYKVNSNELESPQKTIKCLERMVDHIVQPMDNLVSLSVRYRCSTAAIKRANPGIILAQNYIPPKIQVLKIPVRDQNISSNNYSSKKDQNNNQPQKSWIFQNNSIEDEERMHLLS